MSKVTRIGEAAPDSPRYHADALREWADRIDAGEVQALALVSIYGNRAMQITVTRVDKDDDEAFIKLLSGIALAQGHTARRVEDECFGSKTVFELP